MSSGRIPSTTAERRVRVGAAPISLAAVARWVLLACWLFLMGYAGLAGQRPGDLGQLESAIAAGDVHSVTVTPGLPAGASGSTTQDVYWRQGVLRYRTQVVMTTPGSGDEATGPPGIASRTGVDIAADLSRQFPQLRLRLLRIPYPESSGMIYGWQVPSWLALLALGAIVGTVSLLVGGPQPWRATRWAWFWLLGTPVGLILFLVLAGPTPPLRPPRHAGHRLTGGWAFLLSLVLAWFLPHWWQQPG